MKTYCRYIAAYIILVSLITPLTTFSQNDGGGIADMSWSPDGSKLAVGYDYGRLEVLDALTGQPILLDSSRGFISHLSWSPNSQQLVINYNDEVGGSLIDIIDVSGNIVQQITSGGSGRNELFSAAWSPNGTSIASIIMVNRGAASEYWLGFWDATNGQLLREYQVSEVLPTVLAWSPDSTRIVIASSSLYPVKILDTSTGNGLITIEATTVTSVTWNPNGNQIATGNIEGEIHIWNTSTGQLEGTFEAESGYIDDLAWSPDGTRIISSGFRQVDVWDVVNTRRLASYNTTDSTRVVAWSPDGSKIGYSEYGHFYVVPAPAFCNVEIAVSDNTMLITALTTANGSGQPTTICLAEGSTYTFTAAHNNDNGLPRITGNITIEGNGATLTRSGTARFRFFEVLAGGKLTLKNLTLSNGNAGDEPGGAIFNFGEVTLINTTFSHNTAYTGGAIDNQAGTVTITDSRFLNNTATQNAGAIYNSGVATISAYQSCFTGNSNTAVYNYNTTAQDFTHNWWGAANGPSGAGLGSGDSVSVKVNFTPFLTTGCPLQ